MNVEIIKAFLAKATKFSLRKKILLMLAVLAALAFLLDSCSSHRSFSVSVDKAEKVNVQYTDSIDANSPF